MRSNNLVSSDFVRFIDATQQGKSADELLYAGISGQINLAVFAGKWFVWEAEHRPGQRPPIQKRNGPTLIENGFLFVDRNYLERFRDGGKVEMGMFRSSQAAPIDRWCELAKGQKPTLRRNALRILRSELDAFIGGSVTGDVSEGTASRRPWLSIAEMLALKILEAQPELTADEMSNVLAEKMVAMKIKGRGGRTLTAATLRRELPGIKSKADALRVKRASARAIK